MRKDFTEHEQKVSIGQPGRAVSATVASELWRITWLMVWRMRNVHKCLRCIVITDFRSGNLTHIHTHSPPSTRPTFCSRLTLTFGGSSKRGKISHWCKEKTRRLKMLSFHLVKKEETPAFPDNGSHSVTPFRTLWIIHTETLWLRLSVHTHSLGQKNLNGIPLIHYIWQSASSQHHGLLEIN